MTFPLADMGLPMIVIQVPVMICALIPIIIVESLLVRRWVPISKKQAFKGTTLANFVSTAVGVPAAWLGMLALEFIVLLPLVAVGDKFHWNMDRPLIDAVLFVFSAAWVGPSGGYTEGVIIPAASAVLLIPTFFASVWIERRICLRHWRGSEPLAVRRGVFWANLASYGMLFLLACWVAGSHYLAQTRK
jgi:hypothetical protein